MKNNPVAVIFAALVLWVVAARGNQEPARHPEARKDNAQDSKDKASVWMKHKLGASQKILEGMTRGDFEMIEKHAQGMENLGYLEGWVRADVPGYVSHLHAFNQANRELIRASKNKNLDGVTVAYSQLTISCVQCHRFMRDTINLVKK